MLTFDPYWKISECRILLKSTFTEEQEYIDLADISYPTQSYKYFYAHRYSKINFAKNCIFRRATTGKPYDIKVSNFTWSHNFI